VIDQREHLRLVQHALALLSGSRIALTILIATSRSKPDRGRRTTPITCPTAAIAVTPDRRAPTAPSIAVRGTSPSNAIAISAAIDAVRGVTLGLLELAIVELARDPRREHLVGDAAHRSVSPDATLAACWTG
jgi:hypothetical protein